jgi:phosphoribosylanthranilate isomerase
MADMTKVKICGITNLEDAGKACKYGADLIGFVFVEGTPRYVNPDAVKGILVKLKGKYESVLAVGLFKDEDIGRVKETVALCGLDCAQLHGDEDPSYCRELKAATGVKVIKTFKVGSDIMPHGSFGLEDYAGSDYLLFDTLIPDMSGGTGVRFNWNIIAGLREDVRNRSFVAGGLTPGNVPDMIKILRPYGVDVSSGVEKSPGIKDDRKLKEFIEHAKQIKIT